MLILGSRYAKKRPGTSIAIHKKRYINNIKKNLKKSKKKFLKAVIRKNKSKLRIHSHKKLNIVKPATPIGQRGFRMRNL